MHNFSLVFAVAWWTKVTPQSLLFELKSQWTYFLVHVVSKGPGKRGHIVANTNVSPFSRVRNICCRHKSCVQDTKNVSDFVHKHFVSATNVSQFVQHRNTTFTLCSVRLCAQETSWATMCPQQCVLVCQCPQMHNFSTYLHQLIYLPDILPLKSTQFFQLLLQSLLGRSNLFIQHWLFSSLGSFQCDKTFTLKRMQSIRKHLVKPSSNRLSSSCKLILCRDLRCVVKRTTHAQVFSQVAETTFKVMPSIVYTSLANRLLLQWMDVTQLALIWAGSSNSEKLALSCVQIWFRPKWAQVIASQCKSTQSLAKRRRK